jgi:demethylmenaquinone methyltransferase/2-methoxy-6-polyprenyl-1,4-benzoquinol methylase
MVIVEFSTPTFPLFRKLYMNYLMKYLPKIAKRTASNPVAYEYLADSIRAWPDQGKLAQIMSANGWRDPKWSNLTGGVVAVHTGIKRS